MSRRTLGVVVPFAIGILLLAPLDAGAQKRRESTEGGPEQWSDPWCKELPLVRAIPKDLREAVGRGLADVNDPRRDRMELDAGKRRKGGTTMEYVIVAEHQPEFCPTSNAKIREMLKQGAKEIPDLAKKLGIRIITLNVYGPDHVVLAVVEAPDIEAVRDFVMQSRLVQWNRTRIHATWSLEEALAKAESLPTIF